MFKQLRKIKIKKPELFHSIPEIKIVIILFAALIFITFGLTICFHYTGNILEHTMGALYHSILDVLVFGIIIFIINRIFERRREIERWQEEIYDLRYNKSEEAKLNIIRYIKYLNRAGATKINLSYCSFKNMILSPMEIGEKLINLKGAMLYYTDFSHAKLSRITFEGANLSNANLEGANLSYANLKAAVLCSANLKEAYLCRAMLIGANLTIANLANANLLNADLTDAQLRSGDARHRIYLKNANFEKACLKRVDFTGADLSGANLKDAQLDGAIFFAAGLKEALNLTVEQLSKVKTLFRSNLDRELEIKVREKHPHLFENPKK